VILRVLRLAGIATLLLLGGFMFIMFRIDGKHRRSRLEQVH
jgi:hypothetical protein